MTKTAAPPTPNELHNMFPGGGVRPTWQQAGDSSWGDAWENLDQRRNPQEFTGLARAEPIITEFPRDFRLPHRPILWQQMQDCTCCAAARIGGRAFLNAKRLDGEDLSEAFMYALARDYYGGAGQDLGLPPRAPFELGVKKGFLTEKQWPYKRDITTSGIPREAEAAEHKLLEWRNPRNLNEVMQTLMLHQNGVAITHTLFKSYYETPSVGPSYWDTGSLVGARGVVPMPTGGELSGHEQVIDGWIGYTKERGWPTHWWVAGSWGNNVFDGGYALIPHEMFTLNPWLGGAWPGELWTLIATLELPPPLVDPLPPVVVPPPPIIVTPPPPIVIPPTPTIQTYDEAIAVGDAAYNAMPKSTNKATNNYKESVGGLKVLTAIKKGKK